VSHPTEPLGVAQEPVGGNAPTPRTALWAFPPGFAASLSARWPLPDGRGSLLGGGPPNDLDRDYLPER
jgi:hypothetical protein